MTAFPDQAAAGLVAAARRLGPDGLATGTAGNLSVRVAPDRILVTPSAVAYETLAPRQLCLVTDEGAVVEAGPHAPSTELAMHLAAYRATGAGAVVHTHSPFATTLGTVVDELPAVHYLVALLGGPVRVAPYATPGSAELAAGLATGLEGRSALLLGNHGAVTVGPTLHQAYQRAQLLEWLCALYYRARLAGEPRILGAEELARVGALLEHYLEG